MQHIVTVTVPSDLAHLGQLRTVPVSDRYTRDHLMRPCCMTIQKICNFVIMHSENLFYFFCTSMKFIPSLLNTNDAYWSDQKQKTFLTYRTETILTMIVKTKSYA